METIVVDEGKIKCLITGKLRKETPEEYVRQEFTRVLLNAYKYPKTHIDIEFPIKVGVQTKRVDIVVFNSEIKTQDNIYIVVETKSKQETDGVEQLYSYLSSTTANFGVWTNGQKIMYLLKETGVPNKFTELPDIPKYKESIDVLILLAGDEAHGCQYRHCLALRYQDLAQETPCRGLYIQHRLVRFDGKEDITALDRVALLLGPLDNGAIFHGLAQLGQNHFSDHGYLTSAPGGCRR